MLAGNPKLFSILVPLLQPVLGSGVQPAAPAASDAAPAPRRQLRARSKAAAPERDAAEDDKH